MPTTTNYGWTTPADTDLVKDGALAIRTLGNGIDTTTKNLNPETTLGDISYRSSTSNTNTRLAIGTSGQVLTVVSGVPAWAAPAGGGKVLQVIYGSTTTITDITSTTTYADTTLTATITPSAASSKVLILTSQAALVFSSSPLGHGTRILRDSTVIFTGGTSSDGSFDVSGANTPYIGDRFSLAYLDSPNTTSATTYKTQGKLSSGNTVRYQAANAESTIILMEIGA